MNEEFEQDIIDEGVSGDEPLISHNHSNNNNYSSRSNYSNRGNYSNNNKQRDNNGRRTRGTNLGQRRNNTNNNPIRRNGSSTIGGTNTRNNGSGIKNALDNKLGRSNGFNNSYTNQKGRNNSNQAGTSSRNSSSSSLEEKTTSNRSNSYVNGGVNSVEEDDEDRLKIRIPLILKIQIIVIIILVILALIILFGLFTVLFGGVFSDASASAPYEPTCEKVTVKFCFDKEDGSWVTNWSDEPRDYGRYFSVEDCRVEEEEMDFETYIERVVDGEVGVLNNMEVYKAFAVAARTYALNSLSSCTIRSSSKNQVVIPGEARGTVKQAVQETYHEVLLKEDDTTENGVSLASQIEYDSFRCVDKDDQYYYMAQPTMDDAGEEEGDQIPVEWVHENVPSSAFACAPVGVNGTGHGRGMSQYGALYYAESNPDSTYKDILKHYYGNKIVLFSCGDYDEEAESGGGDESDLDDFESIYKACELLGSFN